MAQRRVKIFKLTNRYRKLLIRTKRSFPTLLGHIRTKRIALVSVQARNMPYVAKVYANRVPWSSIIKDYDYIICFWSNNFDSKTKAMKRYITLHELWHIPDMGFKRGSREYRKCRKHDIEDSRMLRTFYGVNLENVDMVLEGEGPLLKGKKKLKTLERFH